MTARVAINRVVIGGASQASGVYTGQNMQNNWDAHTPVIAAQVGHFGDYNRSAPDHLRCNVRAIRGQLTYDRDVKFQQSPHRMR